ncbi:MAG TPA: beta-ketoacyl-ACP synthase III, partial [Gammaproteobacteria bacterium]|nr:beta-ketoacyl-ACP synthase III [Gammaproteobacteria bacterium]
MEQAIISGTGIFIPPFSISNAELVASFNQYVRQFNEAHEAEIEAGQTQPLEGSSEEFILKASGIENRYVWEKSGILDPERMCPMIPERDNSEPSVQCEMATQAAAQALTDAAKSPQEIDGVLVACSNMQRPYPAMAVEIQAALGMEQGYGFDINVACSSATFGIEIAANAIRAGTAKALLVISPEITSGHLNFRDRDSHFIFGDVCTAVVVEAATKNSAGFDIVSTKLRTQFSNNIRNNFGFLNRADETGIGKKDKLFVQNGRSVFKEVVPMVAAHILEHCEELDWAPETLKRLWLHQANLGMNQLIAKKVL